MEINEKDRLLFMKYALPCAGTLVKRGKISQNWVDNLIAIVKTGKKIPEGAEKKFAVAFAACSLAAMEQGKSEIDRDVIYRYYLFEHDKIIDKRYEEMHDFDPEACRIRPGIVKAVGKDFAVVKNSLGSKNYRTDFCMVVVGDLVTTHWDFIVEKISKQTANEMQKGTLKVAQ